MSKEVTTIWQQHDLDDVIRYFAESFKAGAGKKILRYEFTVDTHRRIVTFQIFVQKQDSE